MSQSSQSSRDIIAMVLVIICGEMSVFHHGHHRLLANHYHHRSGHEGPESHGRGHHMCFSKFDQDYHWKGVLDFLDRSLKDLNRFSPGAPCEEVVEDAGLSHDVHVCF